VQRSNAVFRSGTFPSFCVSFFRSQSEKTKHSIHEKHLAAAGKAAFERTIA